MSAVVAPQSPPHVPPSPAPGEWQPYRWTTAAYRQLDGTRLFDHVKTMLIDGEIFVMPPPKPPHDVALELTAAYLRAAFPGGHFVRSQMGFDIGTRTDPSPDLAVVVGSVRDHSARTPTAALLVVEVAETSLFTDTTTKAEWYATAGVPDYWVVDLEGRRLLVFRDPHPLPAGLGATAYKTRLALGPADTVAPLAAPAAAVRVADLLP